MNYLNIKLRSGIDSHNHDSIGVYILIQSYFFPLGWVDPCPFAHSLPQRRIRKKRRKTHWSRKWQLNTWEKNLKTTHHSHKQTYAQTISEQCLLGNIPSFLTNHGYYGTEMFHISCPAYVPVWTFILP